MRNMKQKCFQREHKHNKMLQILPKGVSRPFEYILDMNCPIDITYIFQFFLQKNRKIIPNPRNASATRAEAFLVFFKNIVISDILEQNGKGNDMKKMLLGIAMLLFTIILALIGINDGICIAAGLFALALTGVGYAEQEK